MFSLKYDRARVMRRSAIVPAILIIMISYYYISILIVSWEFKNIPTLSMLAIHIIPTTYIAAENNITVIGFKIRPP
jgi:hypothetical protein